jgi:hypothetical protein
LSDRATTEGKPDEQLSAHSNLMELYLLAKLPLLAQLPLGLVDVKEAESQALEQARQLRKRGRGTSILRGAARQLARYVDWFPFYNWSMAIICGDAAQLLKELSPGYPIIGGPK